MTEPAIGPILMSTVFSRDAKKSIDAWCTYLHQSVHSQSTITEQRADILRLPELSGRQSTWLANKLGEPWLNIIQSPDEHQNIAFQNHGWLSLEISVADVDAVYEELKESSFEIIGLPANLDVSDDIKAMQAVGPDGEVLYLTEVKAPVPPFQLPFARCEIDRVFIAVATVPNREEAIAVYENFDHTSTLRFDTKITVLNRALGCEMEKEYPVAAVQLAGSNLVELDEVPELKTTFIEKSSPANGIGIISFATKVLPADVESYEIPDGPFQSRRACLVRGGAGEFLELIEHSMSSLTNPESDQAFEGASLKSSSQC